MYDLRSNGYLPIHTESVNWHPHFQNSHKVFTMRVWTVHINEKCGFSKCLILKKASSPIDHQASF